MRARVADVEPLEQRLHASGEEGAKLQLQIEAAAKDNETLRLHVDGLENGEKDHLAKIQQLEDSLKHSAAVAVEHSTLVASLRARVADVEPLEHKLHASGEEVSKLRSRVDGLESGEKDYLAKIQQLEDSLKHSTTAAVEHSTLVTSLRARVADVEPLEQKLHSSSEEGAKLQLQIDAAAKENETLRLRVSGFENSGKDHLTKIQELEKHSTAAAAEHETLVSNLRARVADIDPLEHRLHAAGEEIGKLRSRVEELQPLQAEVADVAKENEALLLRIHALEKGDKDHLGRIHKLEDSLKHASATLAEEKQHHERVRSRVHELEPFHAKAGELETKLQGETEASSQLRLRVQELEKHSALGFADVRAQLVQAKARVGELEPWQAKYNESSTTISLRDAEIAKLKDHIAELEALQTRLRTQEEQIRTWDRRFSSTVDEKDGEITRLRFEVGELTPLRDQVEMLNSRIQTVVAEKDSEIEQLRGQLQAVPDTGGAAAAPAKAKDERDDLKKIRGIGPVLEKRLNGYGVYWFKQIGLWTKQDIIDFEKHLPEFQNRVERDQWVARSKEEHLKKYGETL